MVRLGHRAVTMQHVDSQSVDFQALTFSIFIEEAGTMVQQSIQRSEKDDEGGARLTVTPKQAAATLEVEKSQVNFQVIHRSHWRGKTGPSRPQQAAFKHHVDCACDVFGTMRTSDEVVQLLSQLTVALRQSCSRPIAG